MYRRLRGELEGLAGRTGQLVLRAATARDAKGQAVVPNRRSARDLLSVEVWRGVLKPYFIGPGEDPLIGPAPQSPYMRLIVEGIRGAMAIQAARQAAIIRRVAPPDVAAWLTGPRLRPTVREQFGGDRRQVYDPFHRFVNPGGYRLSDSGWNTAIRTRAALDRLLDYEIGRGTAAVDIARRIEPFLWPEAARVRTRTPYGADGSYWARRLARTEITAAAGRSAISASQANPYVEWLRWSLSLSHPEYDVCDENATGGPNRDGRYAKGNFPQYPGHPHCLCTIVPEVTRTPAAVTDELRGLMTADILDGARYEERAQLQGAFNEAWLVEALLGGWFLREVLGEEGAAA